MKLTVAQLMVIVDTMIGASHIADRSDGSVFNFTRETRGHVVDCLVAGLGEIGIEVNVATKPIKNESTLATVLRPLLAAWDRGELPKGEFESRVRGVCVNTDVNIDITQEVPPKTDDDSTSTQVKEEQHA
jgi:hypothetical protein